MKEGDGVVKTGRIKIRRRHHGEEIVIEASKKDCVEVKIPKNKTAEAAEKIRKK